MHPVTQTTRDRANARVCGLVGDWPLDWPDPTIAQLAVLEHLRGQHPGAFVAGIDDRNVCRVVHLTLDARPPRGQEWTLTRDGILTDALPGEPYTEEDETRGN